MITPYCIFQTVWEKRIQKLLRFNWSSQLFAKMLCCGWFLHLLHGEHLPHCWVTNPNRNVKFIWRRPMHVRFIIKIYIHSTLKIRETICTRTSNKFYSFWLLFHFMTTINNNRSFFIYFCRSLGFSLHKFRSQWEIGLRCPSGKIVFTLITLWSQ